MLLRRFAPLLVAGACMLTTSAPALGAADAAEGTPSSLGVSPTRIDIQAVAGDEVVRDLQVTATGSTPLVVSFVHSDFGFTDGSYGVTFIPDDSPETTAFSTRGWFTTAKRTYRVPADSTITVPVTISIPENTPGGTYLGAAFLTTKATDDPNAQVRSAVQTGPLVFISVDGGDPPKPRIKRFDVPRLVTGGPIKPRIEIENSGDEWFAYEGTLRLARSGNDEVVEIGRQVVVPGQPRTLSTNSNAKGADGEPVLGAKRLGIGRHEIVSRLRIDPSGSTIVSTRTVWVIPVWLWIIGIVLMLAIIAGAIVLVRRFQERRYAEFLDEDSDEESLDDLI